VAEPPTSSTPTPTTPGSALVSPGPVHAIF
jgi:hypothetical protein